MYYFFFPPEITGSLAILLLMVLFYGVVLFGILVAASLFVRFIWFCIKYPIRDTYNAYLNFKKYRERTKYSRKRKKKKEWYDDYGKFR